MAKSIVVIMPRTLFQQTPYPAIMTPVGTYKNYKGSI
jgi:hypothetical protein